MMRKYWPLAIASVLLLVAVLMPKLPFPSKKFDYFMVIDITRSMNVPDYQDQNGDPLSRLEKVKTSIIEVMQQLPCGSRVSLGVFTERMPTMLFSPVEVCDNYQELRTSIQAIDWRMAWVADSNIYQGVANILTLMHQVKQTENTLVFFTDGQEAPPINLRYMPDLGAMQTNNESGRAIKGFLVGTGDHALSRIPKFDDEGLQIGFYTAEDVPHRSTFGLPEDPTQVEGYHPRNGPWGNIQIDGSEHLSSVREEHLKVMAEDADLQYHHLTSTSALHKALTNEAYAKRDISPTDLSSIPAAMAFLLILLAYFSNIKTLLTRKWR